MFWITRRGAVTILKGLLDRGWINMNGLLQIWQDLKWGDSCLLPTGAKMFRNKQGYIGIYGYSQDKSDIAPYYIYKMENTNEFKF